MFFLLYIFNKVCKTLTYNFVSAIITTYKNKGYKMLKELKSKIESKRLELRAFAIKKWKIDVAITVSYDLTSSRTLGTYNPRDKVITLNEGLLTEYGELYIDDVFIHEFCHAIVHSLYPTNYNGRKKVMPHGKEFKAVCSWFGNDGKSTTSLFKGSETIKATKKKSNRKVFVHKCNCMSHEIGAVRHNKILRGAIYKCRACKVPLSLNGYLKTECAA